MSYPQSEILPTSLAMILNEITKTNLKKRRGVVRVLTALSEMPFESLLVDFRERGIEIDCQEVAREGDFELWNCTAARRLPAYKFVLTGNLIEVRRCLSRLLLDAQAARKWLNSLIFQMQCWIVCQLMWDTFLEEKTLSGF